MTMKNYIVTVNGVSYEVSVEEAGETSTGTVVAAPKKTAPAPKKAAAPKKATGAAGAVSISAPMPGKILAVKQNEGTVLKKGDVILVLEAMKMENEIVAPADGTIATINVAVGDAVEAGKVLATMN